MSADARVLSPGLFTTVQDLGRWGWRSSGVPVGGTVDPVALRLGNLLAGNPEGAAALEMTLMGPTLVFGGESVAVLCGGAFEAWLDGEPLEPLRPYYVPKGAVLAVRKAAGGSRGLLAVAGGIATPPVLGSRSTYSRAQLGGLGRPLAADDVLPLGPLPAAAGRLLDKLRRRSGGRGPGRGSFAAAAQLCTPALDPAAGEAATLRVLRGREAERFTPQALERFFNEQYKIRPEADRMGVRLSGPELRFGQEASILSEAVAPGAVQVPPDGQPIVLMPDCGTTGGYPRIAHVAAVDLPLLGQLRPGMPVRFQEIPVMEAEALLLEREIKLARFKAALDWWMRSDN